MQCVCEVMCAVWFPHQPQHGGQLYSWYGGCGNDMCQAHALQRRQELTFSQHGTHDLQWCTPCDSISDNHTTDPATTNGRGSTAANSAHTTTWQSEEMKRTHRARTRNLFEFGNKSDQHDHISPLNRQLHKPTQQRHSICHLGGTLCIGFVGVLSWVMESYCETTWKCGYSMQE